MARPAADLPLIGRTDQVRTLLDALEEARNGRPGALLVSGDAGVGKTRLVTELTRLASRQGSTVLVGHCVDLGEAGVPYLAFAEALGALVDDAPGAHPVLERWLRSGTGAGDGGSRLGQLQLFDAVLSALDPPADREPTVLVLEDLHWADRSSRDLLAFLVRRLRSQRLLVVGTVRSDDLHRRHPLRPLVAELGRLPVVERIALEPFTADELGGYVHAVTGRAPGPELVERLLRRTDGNPYFTEQLLASEAESADAPDGTGLPEALVDLLLARVDALSPGARDVVRAAAVAGARVPHQVLARASGLDADDLDAALRESVARHVLVASGNGYAFRHALAREAVYADLLPGERVRLHATFARLLDDESRQRRGHAGELAYHRMASHDVPGALTASVRAADEALHQLAPAEALQHLERVLQLWDAVDGAAESAGEGVVHLTLRAATAAGWAGMPGRAAALARDAVRRADAAGTPAEAVVARRALAEALLAADRPSEGLVAATEAEELAAATGAGHGEEAARAGGVAARAQAMVGRVEDAVAGAQRVLELARRSGWADLEADVLTTLASAGGDHGSADGPAPLLERAMRLARAAGALGVELRVAYNLAVTTYESGDVLAALQVTDEAVARAEETGLSWSDYGLELRVLQVMVRYAMGDLSGSRRLAELAGQRPSEVVLARLSAAALPAAVAGGDPDAGDVVARLEGAWQHDGQIAMVAGAAGAELLCWNGDPSRALATVDRALEHVSRVWEPWFMGGIWLSAVGLAAAGDLAERARLVSDSTGVEEALGTGRRLLDRARSTAELGSPRGGRMGPEGRAWLVRAHAEWARLEGRAEPGLWREAVAAFEEAARGVDGYEPARCRWRLAEALLATGDRTAAAEQASLSAATARRIHARPLLAAVAALVARGRLDAVDRSLPRDRVTPASALTARELQVLGLLAEGLTNREAGRRLFVSDKTVSVHVSNLLAKLGARSRTEAVTIAHRRGLLPDAVAAVRALRG